MKIKRNKKIIPILVGAAFLSLGSVGFASWVINSEDKEVNTTINVEIGEIVDASLTAAITDNSDLNNPIRFDSLSKGSCTGDFITNGDGKIENLDVNFTYTITGSTALNTGKYKVNYTFGEEASALSSAIGGTPQYIDTTCLTSCEFQLPTGNETVTASNNANISNEITYNSGFTVATIKATIVFKWGKAFENKNPCTITSEDGFTAERIKSTLEAFKNAFEGASSSITLTITPSRSE